MNKKWYQSALWKGFLLVAAHVGIVTAVICTVWLTLGAGVNYLNPAEKVPETYSGTSTFGRELRLEAHQTLETVLTMEKFETDGKLDKNKLVDIQQYHQNGTISGKNESGVAYRLGDLVEWSQNMEWEYDSDIVVCQKADGSYYYYRWSEFESLIREGKLNFVDQGQDISYYLDRVRDKYEKNTYGEYYGISDEKGTILYNDCWKFYNSSEYLKERYAPDGVKDILEIVNQNEAWNGKLSELYAIVSDTVSRIGNSVTTYETMASAWKDGNTNCSYMLIDRENQKVYTNRTAYQDYKNADKSLAALKKNADGTDANYVMMSPNLDQFESNMDVKIKPSEWQSMMESFQEENDLENCTFIIAVDTSYPVQDSLYESQEDYQKIQPYIKNMSVLGWIGLLVFLTAVVWMTAVSGRSNRKEGVVLNHIDRLPTELALAAVIGGACFFVVIPAEMSHRYYDNMYGAYNYTNFANAVNGWDILAMAATAAGACFCCSVGYLSLVRRLKAHVFWKNCLVRRILRGIRRCFCWAASGCAVFWYNRKIVTRRAVLFGGFLLIHYFAMMMSGYMGPVVVLILLAADAAVFLFFIKEAIARHKVKEGVQRIAGGDIDYQIPTEELKGENKEMAECVNHIGDGLSAAVEESLKSERLKTDLITNVSHDIKTPLTSIINYVDLLKREQFEDPKIQGYLKILEEKAQRLKTLTEDVVEASKISSGNIKLEFMDLNLVEMIQQTSGEFSEKFEARDLKLISTLPEQPVLIRADGRRMWRVLANIYNNAAKYAMQGTRIYADLTMTDNEVGFSLKNISEQPLNISEDELTERFIRGDVSRSTEGSGLGLSIAKNLTERQNGEFKLYLDGDLFKVTIMFPRVRK